MSTPDRPVEGPEPALERVAGAERGNRELLRTLYPGIALVTVLFVLIASLVDARVW